MLALATICWIQKGLEEQLYDHFITPIFAEYLIPKNFTLYLTINLALESWKICVVHSLGSTLFKSAVKQTTTSFGLMRGNPTQANPRECLRQDIDAKIKSLEESIRALKYRRNALAPISSLPTEIITIIFSFLCLPATSLLGEKPDHHLVWQPVAHVCHQWREIAINQPLLWSHIDFNKLTLAGVIEILTRAKEAPLHLIARFTGYNDYRFHSFKNVLQSRISQICHFTICTEASYSRSILEELASPAPNLEYLSLSYLETGHRIRVPDTLFDRTTPRLSCLELHNFDVSWRSPLLKGLRYPKIHSPSKFARPSLADWLDTLEQLP